MRGFKILDKETDSFIEDSDNLFVGLNGKVYEVHAACCNGDVWLDTEDVSERYGVYYLGVDIY